MPPGKRSRPDVAPHWTPRAVRLISAALTLLAPLILAAPGSAEAAENDPCGAKNTQLIKDEPEAFKLLGVPQAQQLSVGRGTTVAVVDSGVSAKNPHLRTALLPGRDFTRSGNGQRDVYGRGTAVAAQIAARQVPGSGLIGVAPAARILPVRVYEGFGEVDGKKFTEPKAQTTAEGIRWAAKQPNVAIIVIPTSLVSDNAQLRNAVAFAASRNALVVAAAGDVTEADQSNRTEFPAAIASVLSVTAVDSAGAVGASTRRGAHVEVAAPGANVLTAGGGGDCIQAQQNPSSSYAAGYAAGVAALVASAHPSETPAQWQYRILATALRPAGSGQTQETGWGIIAPYSAINFVNDGQPMGPPNPDFPAPEKSVAPVMPLPPASTDPAAASAALLAGCLGLGLVLVMAGLLLRRLKRP